METTMENVYNPNVLVTYKDINNGEITYPTLKVNQLEWEMERKKGLEKQLSISNSQLGKIIDCLTEEYWFNPNTDKEDILNELCEILDHTPTKEISFSGTISFQGRVNVNLSEAEDFDLNDALGDMYVEINNGDVVIDNYDLEDIREDY